MNKAGGTKEDGAANNDEQILLSVDSVCQPAMTCENKQFAAAAQV